MWWKKFQKPKFDKDVEDVEFILLGVEQAFVTESYYFAVKIKHNGVIMRHIFVPGYNIPNRTIMRELAESEYLKRQREEELQNYVGTTI